MTHPVSHLVPLVHPGHWQNSHWSVPSFCCLNLLPLEELSCWTVYTESSVPWFSLCVRLQKSEKSASAQLCFCRTDSQCRVCTQLFLIQDAQAAEGFLGPSTSVSELNQILNEKGNTLWCNGAGGRDGHISSHLRCVCVGEVCSWELFNSQLC